MSGLESPAILDERAVLYGGYLEFKSWSSNRDPALDEIFDIEIRRTNIPTAATILEIGFGSGHFLDWSRERGHTVIGVELIQSLVTAAKSRGHLVYCGQPKDVISPAGDQFDLVVAFDVFEHLSGSELRSLLEFFAVVIRPGGQIIARFPNGGSPFGLHYQSGDMTHVNALSTGRIMQLAGPLGFQIVRGSNAARPLGKGLSRKAANKLRFLLRDLLEIGIGRMYWGRRVPLDPNLVVVLTKGS